MSKEILDFSKYTYIFSLEKLQIRLKNYMLMIFSLD